MRKHQLFKSFFDFIGQMCVVKLKARREDVEVHLLLQETSGAFSLTKRKEGI